MGTISVESEAGAVIVTAHSDDGISVTSKIKPTEAVVLAAMLGKVVADIDDITEHVVVNRHALTQLVGKYGLPPWLDGAGDTIGARARAELGKEIADALDKLIVPV